MKIKIGKYELENDVECKCIPDGWEIFPDAVNNHEIKPSDFSSAYYEGFGSIIVTNNK